MLPMAPSKFLTCRSLSNSISIFSPTPALARSRPLPALGFTDAALIASGIGFQRCECRFNGLLAPLMSPPGVAAQSSEFQFVFQLQCHPIMGPCHQLLQLHLQLHSLGHWVFHLAFSICCCISCIRHLFALSDYLHIFYFFS